MNEKGQLTEQDLLVRLESKEHTFVERKAQAHRDVIKKTAVAFANTVRWPNEGVIFVGIQDRTGKPTGNLGDTEQVQKKIRGYLDECFPPIPYYTRVMNIDGHDVIAVVITESPNPPHFTGKAYVRKGAETCEASDDLIQLLVEDRLGKIRELRKWVNKKVTVSKEDMMTADRMGNMTKEEGIITEVTAHWIQWRKVGGEGYDDEGHYEGFDTVRSVPLDYVKMYWDTKSNQLHIIVPTIPISEL